MILSTLFIIYTIMCFLSLEAITLVIIIMKHRDYGGSSIMKAGRNFVIVAMALGIFYYITYYREAIMGVFEMGDFLRAVDAVIFYAMGYSWVRFVDAISDSQKAASISLRKYTKPVFIGFMLLSAAAYVFLLDEYYATDSSAAEMIVIALEAMLGIICVVFTLAYVVTGYSELTERESRRYIIIVSILINLNNLWNNTVVIFVFIKELPLNIRSTFFYGVTSVLLLAINLVTIFYLYRKDFSPIFFGGGEKKDELSEEEIIDLVAEKHRLTERERDVMILAYKGLTNPDIAEKLFISRHTVKRHMHNLFEKLDVSTRMELVQLIHSQLKR